MDGEGRSITNPNPGETLVRRSRAYRWLSDTFENHTVRRWMFLAVLLVVSCLLVGCPGDRALYVGVTVRALDSNDCPLAGQKATVVADATILSPREVTTAELSRYGQTHVTDANGVFAFDALNIEPVAAVTGVFHDMIFRPTIDFFFVLPDVQPYGYEVEFYPATGRYEDFKVRYRRFDLQAGKRLPDTYADASGGLDIQIERLPSDHDEEWSRPQALLRITLRASQ